MTYSKLTFALVAATTLAVQLCLRAQTSTPAPHINTAIIPVPRTGGITNRQTAVLERARNHPGDYDIELHLQINHARRAPSQRSWLQNLGRRHRAEAKGTSRREMISPSA